MLENRIIPVDTYQQDKQLYLLQELEYENALLSREIDSILQQKTMLEEELQELKFSVGNKEREIMEIMEKIGVDAGDDNHLLSVHNEQLRNNVEGLKSKLAERVHRHEVEVYKLNEEVAILNNRIAKLEEAEETL